MVDPTSEPAVYSTGWNVLGWNVLDRNVLGQECK
jgi:hypothetical protein